MTTRRPQPRVQRVIPVFMAYPRRQPADDPWQDVAAVAWSIAFLLLIVLLAGWVPVR